MATQRSQYVTIKEAASILSVSPNTLRNWGAAKKIEEYRHPLNNYRLYKLMDLEKIYRQLQKPRKAK